MTRDSEQRPLTERLSKVAARRETDGGQGMTLQEQGHGRTGDTTRSTSSTMPWGRCQRPLSRVRKEASGGARLDRQLHEPRAAATGQSEFSRRVDGIPLRRLFPGAPADPKTFTSTGYDATIGVVMGHMILGMDDPEHRQNRESRSRSLSREALARWEPEFIGPIVDEMIDRFIERGHADLVRNSRSNSRFGCIARILGLPEEDFAQFQRSVHRAHQPGCGHRSRSAASESLREYFAGIVSDRRHQPRDDVISDLVRAQVDGEMLDDEAIYAFLRLFLPAGAETTYRSSGILIYLLLTHRDQLDGVSQGPIVTASGHRRGPSLRSPPLADQSDGNTRGGDCRRDHPRRRQRHNLPGFGES